MPNSIQTVLGEIKPDALGRCLTHEHFSLDFHHFYTKPPTQLSSIFDTNQIRLNNAGFIRQYPYALATNLDFGDQDTHDAIIEEIVEYKRYGGGAIVENTTHGLKRNLDVSYAASKASGIHVIVGTGHYLDAVQEADVRQMKIEDMCKLYTDELVNGCSLECGATVKCGIIGEVGSGWPLSDFEKNAIRATAEVQSQLGCPVSFHPGRQSEAPFEIVRLYLEAGGKADKCVMSHLERTLMQNSEVLEFAELGSFCQLDLFGTECSYYQLNSKVDMPSDAQRLATILSLVNEGRLNQVLMSHDIHTKHRLTKFGGHGFSHILNNVLPRLVDKGLTADDVDQISIGNPAQWLQYDIKY